MHAEIIAASATAPAARNGATGATIGAMMGATRVAINAAIDRSNAGRVTRATRRSRVNSSHAAVSRVRAADSAATGIATALAAANAKANRRAKRANRESRVRPSRRVNRVRRVSRVEPNARAASAIVADIRGTAGCDRGSTGRGPRRCSGSSTGAEREGRGRRDRRRRGNRGEPRPERAPIEAAAVEAPADALTQAGASARSPRASANSKRPSKPHRSNAHRIAIGGFRFSAADCIALSRAAPVQPVPPVTVAPIEHVFAPVDAETESKPPPRPAATPRPIPELPPVSLTLPPDSGLELVETKFKAAPMAEPEQPAAAGPRRVRPPKVAVVEEPLQIVETQRTQLPPTS